MTSLKQNDRFFFLLLEVSTKGDLNIAGPTGQTLKSLCGFCTLYRGRKWFSFFLLLQIQQVNQGCRSSCSASEEFVAKAKHCAATTDADNEIAMETQPLQGNA